MKKEQYIISGMACAACSAAVNRVVSRLEGVKSCDVNLITGKMTVDFDEQKVGESDFIRVVEKAGFGISKQKSDTSKIKADKNQKTWRPLLFSGIFSFLLLVISMGPMIFKIPLPEIISPEKQPYNYAITQLLLTLPALLAGKSFFLKGIPLLFKGHPNMDSLVAVGASTSFIYSLVMTYSIATNPHAVHNLYFESVAVVITLIMLGKYFEGRAKSKTADAIKKLMELAPDKAIVLRDGKECTLPISEVKVGDILVVRSGEKIPLDGIVTEGISDIDEAMLTGESLPINKTVGDSVTGGSINLNGLIKVEVTRVGEDTALAKIIRFVEEAQSKKAPISKTADIVAGVFVPIVILIAIISAGVWLIIGKEFSFALKIFTGVLVVACPCALGLATPTAIMVGTGLGAKNGILIRNGEVLQTSHKIKAVVFDKTGTVTRGRPEVTDIISEKSDDAVALAVLAESGSNHPLAEAIRNYAKEKGIVPTEKVLSFENVSGKGSIATIKNGEIILGSAEFLEENGISLEKYKGDSQNLLVQGKSVVFVATNREPIALIAIADSLKKESNKAFLELKKAGIKTVLLSGDNRLCAEYIGKQLDADEVYAQVLPTKKAEIIDQLRKKYGSVMMVGDGINDAPALAKADVGCAIGEGSDIAIDSADIVLMKNNPQDAARALNLSRLTIRNIKQNLFWAFCYNTVLIPVAAGVLYPLGILLNPMLCGLAMSLSSVFVVGNALRLRGKKL